MGGEEGERGNCDLAPEKLINGLINFKKELGRETITAGSNEVGKP